MKCKYRDINFRDNSLELISLVNKVVGEYSRQGFELTLRQNVTALRDDDIYNEICHREAEGKAELKMICDCYDEVVEFLKE